MEPVLKTSALLYFKEALGRQEYESCAELAAAARELGAQQGEIDEAIAAHLRGDQAGAPDEGKQPVNRLRALKEEN
jgi:hypothetical protein